MTLFTSGGWRHHRSIRFLGTNLGEAVGWVGLNLSEAISLLAVLELTVKVLESRFLGRSLSLSGTVALSHSNSCNGCDHEAFVHDCFLLRVWFLIFQFKSR